MTFEPLVGNRAIEDAFRLKVFAGERLHRLLLRAKKRQYWEVPIPVGEFDSAPGPEAVSES